jgi:pimeloyl-ACP methyl ester carboxylesterase
LTYPSNFQKQDIATNGITLHTRIGGSGPAVVLLHGYGETGDMWVPLAGDLARDHTVIIPDLRGMGLSARPAGGYDKKTQGQDIAGLLGALKIARADLVTHDIGNMVGYAFAAQHRDHVTRFVLIDAPLPGVGPWEEILKNPLLWHFRFGGPDMERLVAGRERIYLDRFWNEFSATPARFSETAREHYSKLYARRDACGVFAIRRLRSGRDRQQGFPRRWQADNADACARRRQILRRRHGEHHGICCQQRDRWCGARLGPLDHGRESAGDGEDGAGVSHLSLTQIC